MSRGLTATLSQPEFWEGALRTRRELRWHHEASYSEAARYLDHERMWELQVILTAARTPGTYIPTLPEFQSWLHRWRPQLARRFNGS